MFRLTSTSMDSIKKSLELLPHAPQGADSEVDSKLIQNRHLASFVKGLATLTYIKSECGTADRTNKFLTGSKTLLIDLNGPPMDIDELFDTGHQPTQLSPGVWTYGLASGISTSSQSKPQNPQGKPDLNALMSWGVQYPKLEDFLEVVRDFSVQALPPSSSFTPPRKSSGQLRRQLSLPPEPISQPRQECSSAFSRQLSLPDEAREKKYHGHSSDIGPPVSVTTATTATVLQESFSQRPSWEFFRIKALESKPARRYHHIGKYRQFSTKLHVTKIYPISGTRNSLVLFSNIIAGNDLFKQLGLENVEKNFLETLFNKWNSKKSLSRQAKSGFGLQRNSQRLLQGIDFSNKSILLKIARLNQIFSKPLFEDKASLLAAQKSSLEYLMIFWKKLDKFDKKEKMAAKLEDHLRTFCKRGAFSETSFCSLCWTVFLHVLELKFPLLNHELVSRQPSRDGLKEALNDIMIEEALLYARDIGLGPESVRLPKLYSMRFQISNKNKFLMLPQRQNIPIPCFSQKKAKKQKIS
ncbi:hypothetical protein O181_032880 [Austropuccinia psidii MF-1]|uniref:Uncharacterized protein n=1 Tax=Austropuccinia psidii MF-1 TaxID=1389203 RepID=A0A9Q3H8N2_9BASI|nr:hypothetical protein [Austropuccinia psidii MF-1]